MEKIKDDRLKNNLEISILRQAGIDAIYDYERSYGDDYQHGTTTVVLSPKKLRILAIHEV